MQLRVLFLALVSAVALLVPAASGGGTNALIAIVGPGFNISLTDAAGNAVTALKPGTYTVTVRDRSDQHNFHLRGPGVNEATDVEFVGERTWTINVSAGTYTYVCDPHSTAMRGSFTVETSPPAGNNPAVKQLSGVVAKTIVLRFGTAPVRTLKAGTYDVSVRDTSARDNFHLTGPGVNRRTGVAFRGSVKWRLKLAKGVYRYRSDRNRKLGGSFRVT